MHISHPAWLTLLFLLLSSVSAQTSAAPQRSVNPALDETLVAAGFLDGHPDMRFRKAAWYGDKASQAIVGEMMWAGKGTERDQVMALVWMDLAAERGYPRFVNTRNGYWNALSPAERQLARDRVENAYAEYGDAVTAPRIARVLRRERSKMTGSRVGSQTSQVEIIVPGHGRINASRFYDPQYWDPAQYRAWQDDFWQNLREGRVNVGEPEKVDTDAEKPADSPPPR